MKTKTLVICDGYGKASEIVGLPEVKLTEGRVWDEVFWDGLKFKEKRDEDEFRACLAAMNTRNFIHRFFVENGITSTPLYSQTSGQVRMRAGLGKGLAVLIESFFNDALDWMIEARQKTLKLPHGPATP